MKSEKIVGAIVVSVISLVLIAVIVFASMMNGNKIVTANGDLMEGIKSKRITKGVIDDKFKKKYADFCFKLIDDASGSQENVGFAPSNIMNAVAFLAAASNGDTATELENALGLNAEAAGKSLSALENKIKFEDVSGLKSSTTAWLNSSNPFGIRKSFLKRNAKFYGLNVKRENFALDKIEDIANEDILDVTRSNTYSTLNFVGNEFMNILTGASFVGEWETPSSEKQISAGLFAGSISEQECDFFTSVEGKFIEGSTYIGAVKELKGGYSFVGLVPKEDMGMNYYGVADITRNIKDGKGLLDLYAKAKEKRVRVDLPNYANSVNVPTTTDFKKALQDMGISAAFKIGAEMDNLAPNSYNLHVSNVAAAGDIGFSLTGCCPEGKSGKKISEKTLDNCEAYVRFDSSFVYFIFHNETGLPIYCGIMNRLQ